jgi:DNA-binding response OmpR family regulator
MVPVPTVLLVADDPGLRDTIELELLREGYRVLATGDGRRAIELAGKYSVDVALIDLLLPGQSGFQVTTDLRSQFGDAVRVAMMSGTASPAHRDYALAAGVDVFLAKPVSTRRLLGTLSVLCPLPAAQPPNHFYRTARIGA